MADMEENGQIKDNNEERVESDAEKAKNGPPEYPMPPGMGEGGVDNCLFLFFSTFFSIVSNFFFSFSRSADQTRRSSGIHNEFHTFNGYCSDDGDEGS